MVTLRARRRLLARRSRSLPPPARGAAGSRGRARGAAGRGHGSPAQAAAAGSSPRVTAGGVAPAGLPDPEREVGGDNAGREGEGSAGPALTAPPPTPRPAHHPLARARGGKLGGAGFPCSGKRSPNPEDQGRGFSARNPCLCGLRKAQSWREHKARPTFQGLPPPLKSGDGW